MLLASKNIFQPIFFLALEKQVEKPGVRGLVGFLLGDSSVPDEFGLACIS